MLRFPNNFPSPPADFVGRKAETLRLVNAVKEKGVTLLGVRGIGGIGKTALALAVADMLAADFPMGQIYLDLKGARHKDDSPGLRPLTNAEVMDHVIRSFDPTAMTATTDAEREGLYRTILSGKRVLLVMDNARNAQQVECLAPPVGCLMIVTSREHFTLPGIFAEDLPVLPPEDAHELMFKIASNIGSCAIEIAKLCGYLAEALRTAASALASAPNLSAEEFLSRMNSVRQRLPLTGVELSLATSSELLSENLRERWFKLGVFPSTFDDCAASAVWRTSNVDGKNTLSSLWRYSLVEFDPKHNRYYLHDLVRDFAVSRCPKNVMRLAQFRHSKYYAEILAAADYLYTFSGAGVLPALELFDTERTNIEFGQRWAGGHANETEDAARLCVRYSDVGRNIILVRLNNLEQISWLGAGVDTIPLLSKPRPERRAVFESEVRILDVLVDVHLKRGELQRADQLLRRSYNRREDLHLVMSGISESTGFGDLLRAFGKKTKALKLHWEIRSHIEIAKGFPVLFRFTNQEDITKAECRVLGSLGEDFLALKKGENAVYSFREQLRIAEETGDRHTEMRALAGLGIAHRLIRRYEDSIQFLKQSLAIAEELGDKEGQADAFFNMAIATFATKDRIGAIEYGNTARTVYEQIKSPSADQVRSALLKWRDNSVRNQKKRQDPALCASG